MGTLFYADDSISFLNLRFENDVKMYGTQAGRDLCEVVGWFENDVKMYGTQACEYLSVSPEWFENDVKMYGTQAYTGLRISDIRLRMM